MEEFLNIDWHPPLEDMIDDAFINEQRMKDDSAMYRIMQGLFTDPFIEFESDDSEDANDDDNDDEANETDNNNEKGAKENKLSIQKPRDYIPGLIKPPFKFPRVSSLNTEQHALCLKVLLRFSGRQKPEIDQKSRSELDLYMELCPKIKKEQKEYLDLAKDNWNGSTLKLIGKEYINTRWRSKVEKLRKLPRYYVAAGSVPFNGEEKIGVKPEATLLEMGQLPRVMIPSCNKKRHTIYCNMPKLELLYPARNDSILEKLTVSEDPNCERLAESGEADLVISSGGLNCLANNFGPNYNNSWILPIVVKETTKGNVIYIDKPLPPTAMSIPQKNTWIYKYILKSQLLNPNHHTSISLSDHKEEESAQHGLFGDGYSDLLKLEEENDQFQCYGVKRKSEEFESVEEKTSASKDQSTIDDPMDISDLTVSGTGDEVQSFEKDAQISQELPVNSLKSNELDVRKKNELEMKKVSIESVESANTVLFSNGKTNGKDEKDSNDEEMLDDQSLETESHEDEDSIGNSIPPVRSLRRNNVAYKIFSLGPSEADNDDSLKTKVENYRILVRIKIDGIEKLGKETLHPVMLVPKLEHQVALGAEAVTAEEALKQWSMLTYRPNTSLLRIRISADTSEVIQIERRTAISINNEIKRLYKLNVEDSLIILHNVVHHLKSLKAGNYLLRHTPTNGAFATVYQEADSSGKNVFDLHSNYAQNSFQTIGNVPWPPLDNGVITPAQICLERMPAMYHPARNDKDIASKVSRGRGGGMRGRGRGVLRGAGRGGLQNSERGGPRGGSRGGKRVRTKKAKKKNKGAKKQEEQS